MMIKFLRMYQFLSNIGIQKVNVDNGKKIKLLNIYITIWYHFSLFFISLDLVFSPSNKQADICIHLLSITILIFTQWLSYKGFFKWSRLVFILQCFVVFYIMSYVLAFSPYTVCFFVLLPLLVMGLYNSKKPSYIVLVLSIVIFNFNDIVFGRTQGDVTIRHLLMLKDPVVLALFFAIFYLFHYFKVSNEKNELLLKIEKDKVLNDKIILEKQQGELQELNKFKSHFFVNLSHEIRTPLTLAKGYLNKIEVESKSKNHFNIASEQLDQIHSIVDSILDLSKMDANKLLLNKESISVLQFLNQQYGVFKMAFDKKNIDFQLEIAIDDLYVEIDVDLMTKAISNLLSNALKFTTERGAVRLSVNKNEEGLIISVQDNGLGIREDELENVFKRFYQAKNHITQSQGSGLGLNFTKSIVDEHGFEIKVSSTPNFYTMFTIAIPEEALSISKTNITTMNVLGGGLSDQKTILVVDDHEQMRMYIKSLLTDYRVVEANNGVEALEVLRKNPKIHLVLTDYMMPMMDGHQLVTEIKKKHIKTPIIVITARNDKEGKLKMLRLGVDSYLRKPFMEEEFKVTVQKSLQAYQVIEYLANQDIDKTPHLENKFMLEVTDLINEHITEKCFGVNELADVMNISRSSLTRKVKAIFGQTPNQLVMEARLVKAKEILDNQPEINKTKLAASVGMSNTTYFIKKMEERFGRIKIGG